jgi:hypothetical protein
MGFGANVDLTLACCVLHGNAEAGGSDMEIELSAVAHVTRSYACHVVFAENHDLVTPCEALENTLSCCRDLQKVSPDRNQHHLSGPFQRLTRRGWFCRNSIDLEVVCQALGPSCPRVPLSSVGDLGDAEHPLTA